MANPLNQYSPIQSALALLQPTTSYAQKRADADRNLMLQSALTQQAQQQTEVARQQAVLAQQQQAQLMNVPFLERDDREWKIFTDGMRKKIRDRIENDFGGDYEQYAKTMLDQDIQGMSLEAQRSPLYKGALERRNNFLQAQKDAQDGKIYRSVTYRLNNGQQKTAPWEQAYFDFNNGDTNELPYSGAFKVDGKWRKALSEQYSPRVNVLGKFRPDQATEQEIASALIGYEGLSGQDAADYMRRSGALLAPVYYRTNARDPYKEQELNISKRRVDLEGRRVTAYENKLALEEKKASATPTDAWKFTFDKLDNIKSRNPDGSPGTTTFTHFDPNMKPEESRQMQRFDGRWLGDSFMQSTGAIKDEKSGLYTGAGGWAYVAVKNKAGGNDLRATNLDGLHYVAKPGDIFRYEVKPSLYQQSIGQEPYEYMQEQFITLTSDEAKKAKAGKLFQALIPGTENLSNPLGNEDTPTGKGAYKVGKNSRGETVYQFRILQRVKPTAIDRVQPTLDRKLMNQSNQDALLATDDDMGFL